MVVYNQFWGIRTWYYTRILRPYSTYNWPRSVSLKMIHIEVKSINIWLRYDQNLEIQINLFHKEAYTFKSCTWRKSTLRFDTFRALTNCGNTLKSYFICMKQVHLEIGDIQILNWGNTVKLCTWRKKTSICICVLEKLLHTFLVNISILLHSQGYTGKC